MRRSLMVVFLASALPACSVAVEESSQTGAGDRTDGPTAEVAEADSQSVCNFINLSTSYACNGTSVSRTTQQYAEWVSYQSYRAANYNLAKTLPVFFFVDQWGQEDTWGTAVAWSQYYNTANHPSCGVGNVVGSYHSGAYAIFASIRDGVRSYANLLLNGYPHVPFAHAYDGTAFVALGQGYHPQNTVWNQFCGIKGYYNNSASYNASSNGSPTRIWAGSLYRDLSIPGSGPGSGPINSYNNNTCLKGLNYKITSPPNMPCFTDLVIAGVPYSIHIKSDALCLDVNGGSTSDGAKVQQWACTYQNNQKFVFKDSNGSTATGYFTIVNSNSGKCLDVAGMSTADGAPMQQWTCAGTDNQLFSLQDKGSGYYSIVSKKSQKCLDVSNWSSTPGIQMQQWTCTGNDNQKFQIN